MSQEAIKRQPRISAKMIALTGITAAIYVVCTYLIAPLSYGPLQFRFSEVLILLAFLDISYAPGLILGCAIANLFSPLGIIDVFVGTFATSCTVFCVWKTKKLLLATLWPTVFCIFVGFELWAVEGLPFLATTLSVMIGEFVVVTMIGYPLFKTLMKNRQIMELLHKGEKKKVL